MNINAQNILINEVVAKNVLGYLDPLTNEYPDWIELKNTTGSNINIGGSFLTNDETQLSKWVFPVGTVIPSNGFLLVLADEENTGLHANFKLSSAGEKVILSNSSLVEVDRIEYSNLQNNVSYGKINPTTNSFLSNPTPNAPNNLTSAFTYSSSELTVSLSTGVYATPQTLTISSSGLGSIYYTLDGTTPTAASSLYSAPLSITTNTIFRTIIIENPAKYSLVENRTFLIGVSHDLPIVILTSDNYFFDLNNHEKIDGRVEFTFLESDGTVSINQYANFRPSGNTVQGFPQLAGKVNADEAYGKKDFNYKMYENKPIEEFNSFLFRNASQDFANTHLRDAYISNILGKNELSFTPFEAYRPAVLYVNGKYRGITEIREDNDNDYIEHNFCLDMGEYLRLNDYSLIPTGQFQSQGSFVDFSGLDFTVAADRDEFKTMIDFHEHLALKLLFSFAKPSEWGWTTWEDLAGNTETRYHYNFHDFDPIFGLAGDGLNYTIINSTPMLVNNLMETQIRNYTPFKNEAIHFICANLNHIYSPTRIVEVLDDMELELLSEIPSHADAIADLVASSFNSYTVNEIPFMSVSQWLSNMDDLRTNIINRVDDSLFFRIQDEYLLDDPIQITYETSDLEMGFVRIHDIKSDNETFTGTYFKNIPIEFTAEAKPGYRFVNWEGDFSSTLKSINPTFSVNAFLKANFEAIPALSSMIVINEVQVKNNTTYADESGEFDDWIEIFNPTSSPIDLAGYFISNNLSDSLKWQIPATNPAKTTVPANGFLVLWADDDICQGENHLNFKLKETDQLVLMYSDAVTEIQELTFNIVSIDKSYGAETDASSTYVIFDDPTPNFSNNLSQINEQETELDISVFPNPTTGMLHISPLKIENSSPKWSVLDVTGKLIVSGTGLELDITKEKSGLYFLQIENYTTLRIVKN